ncbi:MAG: D-alanyl-D-alanine carboxypeptidase [Clostridia bacterium]|nr:D-alanyl-D-alanine carboxypeptidase [Clostridia bacterium]
MRKIICILMCVVLLLPMCCIITNAKAETVAGSLSAKSAILMEISTGKVLMESNPDEKLSPASITKVMTILLTFEALESGKITLEDKVTASRNASSKGGSQIWLKEGEVMTVHELLKATVIASANDACTALGEHISGDEASFVALMNKRASELGMTNTCFENCSGLDDTVTNHYSTARDVAIMSCELMKHEKVKEYTTIWMDTLRDGKTQLTNTNRLIRFYDGATGLKTGTTSKAGYCVTATAERGGMELVAVVLGSDNSTQRFEDAKQMLNWGFANYEIHQPQIDMSLITDVTVLYGKESILKPVVEQPQKILVKKGEGDKITQRVDMCVDVHAPVEKNQTLGKVYFEIDGKILDECSILTDKNYERRDVWFVFSLLWSSFAKK